MIVSQCFMMMKHVTKRHERVYFAYLVYLAQVLNPEVARVSSNLGSLTLNSLF